MDDSLEHDEDRAATGPPIEALVFLAIGGFSLFIGVVYLVWTSRATTGTEFAGGVALVFAAVFSFSFGLYLWRSVRGVQVDVAGAEAAEAAGNRDPDDVLYLPETSIWPLPIGVGLSLVLTGIPLGWWVSIPGVALLLQGLIGFAHQSRDRT